jgi:diguanylate cyclase (GGDEF)-like protein/putative nucleotidyltransferase with HDIG domain
MLLYKIGLAICVVVVLAATALVPQANNSPYFAYSLLALMAFGLELADGSTMGFGFIILALPQLNWWVTLLMAGSALFIQAVVRRHRQQPKVLLQSLVSTCFAIAATQVAFHAPNYARFDQPARLMIAAGMCFVAQRIFSARKPDLWSFIYYPVAAAIAALFPVSIVLPLLLFLTWRSYRLYERRLVLQRADLNDAVSLHLRTIEALTVAIEAKDHALDDQPRRVQIYAVQLAKEMGLSADEMEALRVASLLYDIGELAVPEHIMMKAGPLTPEEFDKMKTHTAVGAEILDRVRFPYPVAPIVAAHHERWDGAGYPNGLKGDAIPMGARILAAVDTLNALTSARHHRAALSLEEALKHIAGESGRAFDPRVVSRLRKCSSRWEKLVAEQPQRGFIESIFSAQREGKVMSELIDKLGSSLDLNETFFNLNNTLRGMVRFETLVVWVERDGVLVAEYVDGAHLALCSWLRIPMGRGVSGWVANHGKSIVNGDASSEMAHMGKDPDTCPFRCALAVPLAEGVRGALTIYRIADRLFSPEDARVLSAVAPKVSAAVANGLRFRLTSDQAVTDGLTGLPNAGALFGRLSSGAHATVLVCDLDGFKNVNDRFGHLAGNQILRAVADGFRRSCRNDDFVARMGGDEFALLLDDIAGDELGRRIDQFREMIRATGRQICGEDILDASFGAAFYPKDGATPDELLTVADRQMYRRKADQKSGVRRIDQKIRA